MSFAGWLVMNRWLTVPEAPTLHVLWHNGHDAGAIRRAIRAREYVMAKERAGRNVLVNSKTDNGHVGAAKGSQAGLPSCRRRPKWPLVEETQSAAGDLN